MKRLKNFLAIIYKNRRTSFAGLVCLIAVRLFYTAQISTEEFLSVMGFCSALGFFFAKDGQTQTEYDKEHKTGAYTRWGGK